MSRKSDFPEGWNEASLKDLAEYYDECSVEQLLAEDEADQDAEGNPFQQLPFIVGNPCLREPQVDGFVAADEYFLSTNEREASIVLPVGCGKSGLITLLPFATGASRVLVVAPNLRISDQLLRDFDFSKETDFYTATQVLSEEQQHPEPAEIRGKKSNLSDLQAAQVVITNIQQLQGEENRWLSKLDSDFFQLIVFDEGHHNVADSWEYLRKKFPDARIVNLSATPTRADGQLMQGKIIYSYPIFKAIAAGYVKRIKALVLNPSTLRYVSPNGGAEVELTLEQVKQLAASDAAFRRVIVSSKESLETIVDASIRELNKIRSTTGDRRHKIIASAMNLEHCIQVAKAYREKELRADYIHSLEQSKTKSIIDKLENDELDVIVQVRMLGEGFDHRYLSVAAIFSVFANLSPFAQFVGRIMRVVVQNDPHSVQNQGTVVFHAGANVASVWSDFQKFSQADQDFFDQLLPLEEFDPATESKEVEPRPRIDFGRGSVTAQSEVLLAEIPLLEDDVEARRAIEYLLSKGFSADDFRRAEAKLKPVKTRKQAVRLASQKELDDRNKLLAGKILRQRGLSTEGHDLDVKRLGKSNFVIVKSAIDRATNTLVGHGLKDRHNFSQDELDTIAEAEDEIVASVEKELF